MKQKFTLTAAILTLIEFVCLCVPFSLVEVIYYRSSNGIGHTPTYFNNTNIFGIWSSKGETHGCVTRYYAIGFLRTVLAGLSLKKSRFQKLRRGSQF